MDETGEAENLVQARREIQSQGWDPDMIVTDRKTAVSLGHPVGSL